MTKFLNISTDNTLGGASPSNETVSSQKAIKEYVDSQTGTAPAFANITGQPTDNTNLASALNAKYDASNPDGFINNTNDCVHISGTETITGFKTLSAGAKITTTQSGAILELESAAAGTNFLLKRTNGATCVVESGNYIGLLGTYSNHPFQIRTNYVNRMEFGTNGSVTLATAPNENSNDNQVATTAWTNSKIPTVNNATLTIQKNGTSVATFTANSSTNQTANITVPTDTGDLTNGAGFITSSALSGYATETWVGNQGYITGITSSDVTTALGYTPYDASNPNGYTSNVGTVTSVNNVSPENGNVTLSIPTVNNPTITITQGGVTKGSFTLNQSSGDTIALDAGGSSYTAGDGIDITSNVISNTGVRSVSTGTNNGTISVDTNGTSAEVSIAGLGSAAFKSMTSTYDSTGTDPVDGVAVASAISDRADTSLSNLQDGGIRQTVRTGMIVPYDGSTAPSGWRKCDGSAISRTTYSNLFAVIGTTYGSGNGSTTFNLPSANDFPSGYPSTSYSSVTLGSSGTVYTATKNGWYTMIGQASADGQYILMTVPNSSGPRVQQAQALSGQWIALSHPVRKGDKICVKYSITGYPTLRFFEDSGRASIIKT